MTTFSGPASEQREREAYAAWLGARHMPRKTKADKLAWVRRTAELYAAWQSAVEFADSVAHIRKARELGVRTLDITEFGPGGKVLPFRGGTYDT